MSIPKDYEDGVARFTSLEYGVARFTSLVRG